MKQKDEQLSSMQRVLVSRKFSHPHSTVSKRSKVYPFPISYGKFSKISHSFFFLFSNKILIIRAEIHNMLARIANRSVLFGRQLALIIFGHLFLCSILFLQARQHRAQEDHFSA